MLDSRPSSPAWELAGDSDAPTLAAELKRMGLARRARDMERVLFMLRERHRERSLVGPVPAALGQAIAGFSEELGRIRLQLAITQSNGQRPESPESDAKVNGKASV
jgi:hypothetical protein